MAGRPRCEIMDKSEVGTYHCFNRCVRGEELLGDITGGKHYDVRKDWLLEMLITLASIFSIDILKYAVMDNHLHLILRNRPDVVKKWSKTKILRHAMRLFPEKFRRKGWYVEPGEAIPRQLLENTKLIEVMRDRLSDISWLMKVLQERIARRCNKVDKKSGHFWAGRYKSEKLEDDGAVLACAMYIDLNWIRAGKAKTPETSRFTSAYRRIRGMQARRRKKKGAQEEGIQLDGHLAPLNINGDYPGEDLAALDLRASNRGTLEMTLEMYLTLLDIVGRMLKTGKGSIPDKYVGILERLGLDATYFADYVETYGMWSRRFVGAQNKLREAAERLKQQWVKGVSIADQFYIASTAPTAK